jgi:hypothetical protein
MFEHPNSDSVFLFRAYKPRDKVADADVIEVRNILDEKGVLKPEALEELLHQPSAQLTATGIVCRVGGVVLANESRMAPFPLSFEPGLSSASSSEGK